ncbi:MAG: energy transducer TonB [Alistipes sp.]|nr:energy transducer TonB [Alistipes sp.]
MESIKPKNTESPRLRSESNAPTKGGAARKPRRRMQLPFDDRKQDIGDWAYAHRVGLLALLVAVVVFLVLSLIAKFEMNSQDAAFATINVEMMSAEELEQLIEEKERLEEEIRQKQLMDAEWERVRNMQSNDAMLNDKIADDRNTDVEDLNRQAQKIAEDMAANGRAHAAGEAAVEAIAQQKSDKTSSDDKNTAKDSYQQGGVTVRYKFENPTRHKRYLFIPAYRCESGGVVEVAVVLNRSGDVISAKAVSGGDAAMQREAEQAARASRFDVNESAPERHSGTITYTFVPQ